MRKTRIAAALLSAAMLAGITGCETETPQSSNPQNSTPPVTTVL